MVTAFLLTSIFYLDKDREFRKLWEDVWMKEKDSIIRRTHESSG